MKTKKVRLSQNGHHFETASLAFSPNFQYKCRSDGISLDDLIDFFRLGFTTAGIGSRADLCRFLSCRREYSVRGEFLHHKQKWNMYSYRLLLQK